MYLKSLVVFFLLFALSAADDEVKSVCVFIHS